MNPELLSLCESLTDEIKNSYESGITMTEAEKLAGKFLYAQLQVAAELQSSDLSSRMRKTSVKAVKAAVYMNEATKTDKKPSDTFIEAKVNMNEMVSSEQDALDKAESYRDSLHNYLNIFKESHIHFRTIAKGTFNG